MRLHFLFVVLAYFSNMTLYTVLIKREKDITYNFK